MTARGLNYAGELDLLWTSHDDDFRDPWCNIFIDATQF